MANKKNIKQAKELTVAVAQSKGVVLVDYQGTPARSIEELRNAIEEAGGAFHIVKNTLFKIALQRNNLLNSSETPDMLKSPTAVLYLEEDIVTPLKKLTEFTKGDSTISIKGGILDNALVPSEKIEEIAKLPTYEELMAKLVGQIQAPVSGLVRALSGINRNLVYVLDQIRISKGGDQ